MGFVELLFEHAELHGVAAEGVLWRRGKEGKRLRLRLSAEDRPQLLVDTDLGSHVPRRHEGHVRLRDEWRDDWTRHAKEYRRAEESRLARRGRNLPGRNERILACSGHFERRAAEHQNNGVP